MTDKKKRNTTELGPGSACDRILELRRDLQQALLDAQAEVRQRFAEREAAILARVPDDMKARALAMIAAAELKPAESHTIVIPSQVDPTATHTPEIRQLVTSAQSDAAATLARFAEEDEPDQTQVPEALQRPYAPSERLTGKARAK